MDFGVGGGVLEPLPRWIPTGDCMDECTVLHARLLCSVLIVVFQVIFFSVIPCILRHAFKNVIPRGVPEHHPAAEGSWARRVKNPSADGVHLGAETAGQEPSRGCMRTLEARGGQDLT